MNWLSYFGHSDKPMETTVRGEITGLCLLPCLFLIVLPALNICMQLKWYKSGLGKHKPGQNHKILAPARVMMIINTPGKFSILRKLLLLPPQIYQEKSTKIPLSATMKILQKIDG